MFTVVIAGDEAAQFLQEYHMLFQPYEEAGQIAFCHWNQQGTDFKTALPELLGLVRGKKHWRALVALPMPILSVNGATVGQAPERLPVNDNNPFDFCCNNRVRPPVTESEISVIRLAQMLGGVPTPIYEFSDQMVQEDGSEYRDTVLTNADQLAAEKEAWMKLEEKYRFRAEKPDQLWMFAARRRLPPQAKRQMTDRERLAKTEYDSSRFVERNRYPLKTRFLTMDCAEMDQAHCHEDEFAYWMMVLTLALNDFDGGRLAPERLYRLEGAVNDLQLQELLSSYHNRLARIKRDVDRRAGALRATLEVQRQTEELPDYRLAVTVDFKTDETDGLYANDEGVGLAQDCPQPELPWWKAQMEVSRKALARILMAPRRGLDLACSFARKNSKLEPDSVRSLDEYQLDELDMLLSDEEIELFNMDTFSAFSVRGMYREKSRADRATRTNIGRRMTRDMAVKAGLFAMAVYVLGFLPELVRSAGQWENFKTVLLACFTRLGILASAGMLALLWYRWGLVNKVRDYNGVMNGILTRVEEAGAFFSDYLSRVCTYMRGRSILDTLRTRQIQLKEDSTQLEQHHMALEHNCRLVAGWLEHFQLDVLPDEEPGRIEYFNSEIGPEENEAYDLQAGRAAAEVVDSQGQRLRVPYPFVSGFDIRREELFE